jgi:hypothetical protein
VPQTISYLLMRSIDATGNKVCPSTHDFHLNLLVYYYHSNFIPP